MGSHRQRVRGVDALRGCGVPLRCRREDRATQECDPSARWSVVRHGAVPARLRHGPVLLVALIAAGDCLSDKLILAFGMAARSELSKNEVRAACPLSRPARL